MATIIILALFGIVLLGLEVFLPGGIMGTIGLGCSVASIVLCFTTEEVKEVGFWLSFVLAGCVVVVTSALLILWLKHFHRTGVGKMFILDSAVGGRSEARSELRGEEGEAANDLAPLGRVVIGGKKFDARSEAGTVFRGDRVKVVGSTGLELIVRAIGEPDGEGEDASA